VIASIIVVKTNHALKSIPTASFECASSECLANNLSTNFLLILSYEVFPSSIAFNNEI